MTSNREDASFVQLHEEIDKISSQVEQMSSKPYVQLVPEQPKPQIKRKKFKPKPKPKPKPQMLIQPQQEWKPPSFK